MKEILAKLVEGKDLTKEEAMRHRQKEALISFLGIGNVKLMDVIDKPFEMQTGDMVLLCSDVVTKTLVFSNICDFSSFTTCPVFSIIFNFAFFIFSDK